MIPSEVKREKDHGEPLYMDQVTKGRKISIELVNVENIDDPDESRISRVGWGDNSLTGMSLKETKLCFCEWYSSSHRTSPSMGDNYTLSMKYKFHKSKGEQPKIRFVFLTDKMRGQIRERQGKNC